MNDNYNPYSGKPVAALLNDFTEAANGLYVSIFGALPEMPEPTRWERSFATIRHWSYIFFSWALLPLFAVCKGFADAWRDVKDC